jgi:hypothetical protein
MHLHIKYTWLLGWAVYKIPFVILNLEVCLDSCVRAAISRDPHGV